jgi:HD-GYP domain-containing protein (c-di-GMP phosphodiesterase class II)
LTSQRPYKSALSKDAARERLLSGSAVSFDPVIVRAFLNLLEAQPNFTLQQRICAIPVTKKHTYYATNAARI